MLQDSLQEWLKSSCNCDLQMISFLPTCYDDSTIVINMSMRFDQHSTISMYSVIAEHVNQTGSFISGLAICLSPDCKVKSNDSETNTTSATTEKPDNENSLSLIVGPAMGVLCGVIIFLVIIVTLIWVMNKRYAFYVCVYEYPVCAHIITI